MTIGIRTEAQKTRGEDYATIYIFLNQINNSVFLF